MRCLQARERLNQPPRYATAGAPDALQLLVSMPCPLQYDAYSPSFMRLDGFILKR